LGTAPKADFNMRPNIFQLVLFIASQMADSEQTSVTTDISGRRVDRPRR
jgi:hypothetical protein